MKTLKCLSVVILSLLLVIPLSLYTPAEVSPSITAASTCGMAGETVSITVDMLNNPGIVSMTLRVKYDASVLELVEVTDGGILGANVHKPQLTSPYTLAWVNDTSTVNFTKNGTLATLTFKISDNAAEGSYPIEISYNYSNYDVYDKDLSPVYFETVNGAVTVGGNEPASPTLSISSNVAAVGETVNLTVDMAENPGIVSMTLRIKYDTSALELVEVVDGGILGANVHKPQLTSPYTLAWVNDTSTVNFTANGTLATLKFNVLQSTAGDCPVELYYSYDNYDIYDKDLTPVYFETANGMVTVNEVSFKPGDINNDGVTNPMDYSILLRLNLGGTVYDSYNVEAADLNRDGAINAADINLLKRVLLGYTIK